MAMIAHRSPRSTVIRIPLLFSLIKLASATPILLLTQTSLHKPIEPKDPIGSEEFIFKLVFSISLVLAGGVFAG